MRTRTFLIAFALTLAACGGDEAAQPSEPAAAAEQAPAAPSTSGTAEVVLSSVGDEMKYDKTEFTVAPGQTVHLTFNNAGTSEAMKHNVVIVRTADDVTPVGQAAMTAAATEYVPAALADRILAHTPLANPGQTVEVTFTAPTEPGAYPFICTFPGHFAVMQGTMRVEGGAR